MRINVAKLFFMILFLVTGSFSDAQTLNEWRDMRIDKVNRMPLHASFFRYENPHVVISSNPDERNGVVPLDGEWRFLWVENADERPNDFYRTDIDDSLWGTMPVPGMWELNGYGAPIYVSRGFAWRGSNDDSLCTPPLKGNHIGSYRRMIEIPESWQGRQIIARFGSVTSCIYLYVNGKFVGYSEDSKAAAEFDVTQYLKTGKNLFAFQVFRWCDGTFFEDQDFWRLSGVARDSYLYARDKDIHLDNMCVTTDLVNDFRDGVLTIDADVKGNADVFYTLKDKEGNIVGRQEGGTITVENCRPWTAETPYLYTLTVRICRKANRREAGKEVERVTERIGFRHVETKNGQMFLNGKPVLVKGVNRHEMDPDGGYVLSRGRMMQDISLMKRFNINAVRTGGYTNDPQWYHLCDEYGIYICADDNYDSRGIADNPSLAESCRQMLAYNAAERRRHNITINGNHPSIIMWGDCGIPPSVTYGYCLAAGNSCGGIKEYWDFIRAGNKCQGGFITDFADQALHLDAPDILASTGSDKAFSVQPSYSYGGDYNAEDPSDNNLNCNGLVSPDRVPNPQMYEAGYVMQNIWTEYVGMKDGKMVLKVRNENFFRPLDNIRLEWETIAVTGEVIAQGVEETINVMPQQTEMIEIPCNINEHDCSFVNVFYRLKGDEPLMAKGQTVAYRQIKIREDASLEPERLHKKTYVKTEKTLTDIILKTADARLVFSRISGYLTSWIVRGKSILGEGGRLMPNFWRAVTDNDMIGNMQHRYKVWRTPKIVLADISADKSPNDKGVVVTAYYELPEASAKMRIRYSYNGESLEVTEQMVPADRRRTVVGIPRFGMVMQLPYDMDKSRFTGRGPAENYCDRKESQLIGIYEMTADEQFYPYIRPQETGTKSDISLWEQTDGGGFGIKVMPVCGTSMYASALHYDIDELDEGDSKRQRHTEQLAKSKYTNLFLDGFHAGVGGTYGCDGTPEKQSRYHMELTGEFSFAVRISPKK